VAYPAISAQKPPLPCMSSAVNPGWQLLHFSSHCCFPQLLTQAQDRAASKEGWSPSSPTELGQGQELRSLQLLIEKVNKSKQHFMC